MFFKKYSYIILLIFFLSACNNKPQSTDLKKDNIIHLIGETQGTFYSILYQSKDSLYLSEEVDSVLHDFDMSLSTYIQESVISRINNNDTTVKVDNYFKDMYLKAVEVSGKTDGYFDITVAPLVNHYGFGFTEKQKIDSATIKKLLKFVGMSKVELTDNKIIKKYPEIMLDPNAIAQGQSVDVICKFLEKQGIKNYLVEIGGEVRAKGKKNDTISWKVGIDKPIEGNNSPGENLQVIIELKDMALATSGNYRKYYEAGGQKYFHSINPKTGYPEKQNILSATILATDCITADAYATSCMIFGLEKSKKLINSLSGVEAYIVYLDKEEKMQVYKTKALDKMIFIQK